MPPPSASPPPALPPEGQIGRIEPESNRFYKVRKHLLNPDEGWHLICPGLSPKAREEALRAGCTEVCLAAQVFGFELTSEECKQHVLTAHDVHLEPAYRRALASAIRNRCLALNPQKANSVLAFSAEGVFVAVHQDKGSGHWRVATAYRPTLSERPGVLRTPQDYVNAAQRKWKDKQNPPTRGKP